MLSDCAAFQWNLAHALVSACGITGIVQREFSLSFLFLRRNFCGKILFVGAIHDVLNSSHIAGYWGYGVLYWWQIRELQIKILM